jgi:DNA-3-methyladenine glycosylase
MSGRLEVEGLGDPALSDDVVEAARQLLGWRFTTTIDGVTTTIVIIETEAYGGSDDPASHAYRGRTRQNASMFAAAGTLYVYRSYGVHWCANVVTGPPGEASAVLLRAGFPVVGVEVMRNRRGRDDHLADGPGKLSAALGITGAHDGTSLEHGPVRLMPPTSRDPIRVDEGPRVGISRAVDRPLRFVARGIDGSSLAPT